MREGLAPIEAGATYPLPIFQQRSGLGKDAMRAARRNGLKVIRLGGRAFVRGSDFSEFLNAELERHQNDEVAS